MKDALLFTGLFAVLYGLWQIYPPVAIVTGGVAAIGVSYLWGVADDRQNHGSADD